MWSLQQRVNVDVVFDGRLDEIHKVLEDTDSLGKDGFPEHLGFPNQTVLSVQKQVALSPYGHVVGPPFKQLQDVDEDQLDSDVKIANILFFEVKKMLSKFSVNYFLYFPWWDDFIHSHVVFPNQVIEGSNENPVIIDEVLQLDFIAFGLTG